MPFTQQSALTKAALTKSQLAAAKIALFKSSFVPSPTSVLADFVENQCDFTGYTAGGIAIATWQGPVLNPNGGADVLSTLAIFPWATGAPDVTNLVGGWYLTLAAATAPISAAVLWAYQVFPLPVSMAIVGNAIPLVVTFTEGQNPSA